MNNIRRIDLKQVGPTGPDPRMFHGEPCRPDRSLADPAKTMFHGEQWPIIMPWPLQKPLSASTGEGSH